MSDEINLGNYDPDWIQTGGISGGEDRDYDDNDDSPWDTRAWSRDSQVQDAVGSAGGGITVQTRDGGGFGDIIQQVTGVNTITYDSSVFLIQDNGGGEVVVYCAT